MIHTPPRSNRFDDADMAAIRAHYASALQTGAVSAVTLDREPDGDVVSVLDPEGLALRGLGKEGGMVHVIDSHTGRVLAEGSLQEVLGS